MTTAPLAALLLALALGLAALLTTRLLLRHVARRDPAEGGSSIPVAAAALLVVAVIVAVLALLWGRPLSPVSAVQACWAAALAVIFTVDLRVRYILDIFTAPLALLVVLASVTLGQAQSPGASGVGEPVLLNAVGGAVIGLVLFALFFGLGLLLFRQPALGLGDVKLAALLGLMVGAGHILTAIFIGVFLGGLVSLAMILLRRAKLGDAPAYGTYLAIGGYIALLQAAGVWLG